jgi:guanine nucleotide-binding protein G(i) subunit alpha
VNALHATSYFVPHSFDSVTAVIFVVAMDSYDLALFEDPSVNCIQESRRIFDDIVNSKWFQGTNVVLFLNKHDLFEEKIKTVDLKVCFKDYHDGCNYEPAKKFMSHKFKKLNRVTGREIYVHCTEATDTTNVKKIFTAAKDTLIANAMKSF